MSQPLSEPPDPRWHVLSTHVRPRDGARRLEQAFRLLLGPAPPPEAPAPTEGGSDHARSDLRPRLDRPTGTRPDD
jgi:hypothetical protein